MSRWPFALLSHVNVTSQMDPFAKSRTNVTVPVNLFNKITKNRKKLPRWQMFNKPLTLQDLNNWPNFLFILIFFVLAHEIWAQIHFPSQF